MQRGQDNAALFDLRGVSDFSVRDSRTIKDTQVPELVASLKL